MHIEDTQRLVTEEFEMLKAISHLVRRDMNPYNTQNRQQSLELKSQQG